MIYGLSFHRSRPVLAIMLSAAAATSCARATPGTPVPTMRVDTATLAIPPLSPPVRYTPPSDVDDSRPALSVRLREAPTGSLPDEPPPAEPSAVQDLTAERTELLLARLPPLPARDTTRFHFPVASPPLPQTGRVVLTPFPPPDTMTPARPGAPTRASLEVVRIVPAGQTDLPPHVTITFNDAMVPLTTVAGTEARTSPVRLTPQPSGRWTWIDTRTLRFEPDDRFPSATAFGIEVPAGTRSATGRTLARTVTAEFTTPAPRAIGAYPALDPDAGVQRDLRRLGTWYGGPGEHGWSVPHHPIVVIVFDQRVDPTAVLARARLTAEGRVLPLRLARGDEIAADSALSLLVAGLEQGEWVAVKPDAPLPADAEVRVVLGAGMPSAEGPLTTTQPQALRFRTYGPLRIASHRCGADVCRPHQPWLVQLTNPIDRETWSADFVHVEPALNNMSVHVFGATVQITGDARPNTQYRVTLSPSIQDRFGQRLAEPRAATFEFEAPPSLTIPGAPLIVLDPEGPPHVVVRSQGHHALRVSVHSVTPADWRAWSLALLQRQSSGTLQPPGEVVTSTVVEPGGDSGDFSETVVDIGPALRDGLGHAIVLVQRLDTVATDTTGIRRGSRPGQDRAFAWVQSTRIGLTVSIDAEELFVWTSSLESGEPLGGVQLRMLPAGARQSAKPDRLTSSAADGTARLPLSEERDLALIATAGVDGALLPPNPFGDEWYYPAWRKRPAGAIQWHTMTDRGLYQPGETVHLKGTLRHMQGRGAGLRVADEVDNVQFSMRGPRREDLGTETLTTNALGAFSTTVELPEALNLGSARIDLVASGIEFYPPPRTVHTIDVQEFRRPEYEVRVAADPGPWVIGDTIVAMLNAEYYGGGGLGGADLEWRIATGPGVYTPPGWDRWHFGRAPWWRSGSETGEHDLSGVTDASGAHRLLIELQSVQQPFATALRAAAQVHDLTRQIGSAFVDLLVHPAALNAGMRMTRGWLHPGQSAEVQVIVVDHDGRTIAGRGVDVVLERMYGNSADTKVCSIVSGAKPERCGFTVDSSGVHLVRAEVRDDAGRVSRTERIVLVAGGPGAPDPRREPGSFDVVADREEYQPGDTARILIQPPFHPAEAFVTIRNAGVMGTERLRIETAAHELRLPIGESHTPGVRVRVEVVDTERGVSFAVGETDLSVPPQRRALDVHVAPRDTLATPGGEVTIDVAVRDAEGRPAAAAEVTLWMVDESILALGDYTLSDPLEALYAPLYTGVLDQHSRKWIVHWPRSAGPRTLSGIILRNDGRALAGATVRVADKEIESRTSFDGSFTLRDIAPGEYVLEVTAADGTTGRRAVTVTAEGVHVGNLVLGASGLGAAENVMTEMAQTRSLAFASQHLALDELVVSGVAAGEPTELRTDFAPLAFFEPSLRTDAAGRVQVTARLPQSLTRYRIMAVATAGAQHFGTGDAAVTVRSDLMVRVAAPRFLNYGDSFELPVLLQNATSRSLDVEVAARSAGVIIDGPGRLVTLAPGGRAEVRFAASAPTPGDAHVQVIAAAATGESDAAGVVVPVYTPATVEAFATYGTIDNDEPVVLPFARPAAVIDGFGGLEISITATALHALTDAVLYLCTYPFTGSEHLASRVIAVAALRDVLAAFGAAGLPPEKALVASTQRDIADLVARQMWDGGWPFWRDGSSHPFVSMHVAHALQRAREKGFDVPSSALENAARYLAQMESHVESWPLHARQSAASYALYVRHRMGDNAAVQQARALAATAPDRVGGELPVEAVGWLLHVLASDPASRAETGALQRTLLNRLVETAGSVTFAESYEDGEHLLLHSRRRTDAVVLEALIAAKADDDVIIRLAQSLLAHRAAGRWWGTQENSWVLLALDRYFRTYEATTPAFDSRVWLDERFAGGHAFQGRTTERQHIDIPMPQLLDAAPDVLVIARSGAGRMYYRAGVRYAPADLRTPPIDRGFHVSRVYEAVDDPADVQRDADGSWRVRAGARVRVRLTMVAPARRYHAALIDPLPAGLEPLNPELSGTGFVDDPGADGNRPGAWGGMWWGRWFEHQNLRNDRAEAFASLLRAGVHEYSYLTRATTPGTFVVPPPRAEMMYQPETFGRGEGDVVVVQEHE